jgi:predicted MFS family arabinose efflux permease
MAARGAGAVLVTLLVGTDHFAAFTFVSFVLQERAGVPGALVGPLLLGFGAAGIIGNLVAGVAVARRLHRTVLGIVVALTLVMTLHALLGRDVVAGSALLLMWGLAYGGVSVSLQNRMIAAAPRAVEAATALWVRCSTSRSGSAPWWTTASSSTIRRSLASCGWPRPFLLAVVAARVGARQHRWVHTTAMLPSGLIRSA